jgi:DNA-binding NtrC family response regulator
VESGGFRRHGGDEYLPLDVRLVGITRHDPIRESVRFDPRLLDLLSGVRIELAPLREHLDDLPQIVLHILNALTAGKPAAELDPAAYRVLLGHDWPGNAHELSTALQRALLMAGDAPILPAHLPSLRPQPMRDARAGFANEREWILDGLRRNRFRRADAARFLGISRKTLYNKMVELGLLMATARRASSQNYP